MFNGGLDVICLVQSKMLVKHEKNPWALFLGMDKMSTSISAGVIDVMLSPGAL